MSLGLSGSSSTTIILSDMNFPSGLCFFLTRSKDNPQRKDTPTGPRSRKGLPKSVQSVKCQWTESQTVIERLGNGLGIHADVFVLKILNCRKEDATWLRARTSRQRGHSGRVTPVQLALLPFVGGPGRLADIVHGVDGTQGTSNATTNAAATNVPG